MTSPSTSPTAITHGNATAAANTHQAIQTMLTLDRAALQIVIARTLAAMLHDGPGTALEQFASAGKLDAEAILDELHRIEVPFEEEAWADALARFMLFTTGETS